MCGTHGRRARGWMLMGNDANMWSSGTVPYLSSSSAALQRVVRYSAPNARESRGLAHERTLGAPSRGADIRIGGIGGDGDIMA